MVLFHAVGYGPTELPAWARVVRRCFAFGHEAVAVFIVLSGYSLMLPVVRAPALQLSHGAIGYLKRRARRILPPYYATLALTLLLIATIPALRERTHTIWDDSLPAFEPGPLLTHVLLVHNWLPDHAFRIDGPLWSVASEWQIYFFMPFVLLPVWRRYGRGAMLLVAALIGYAPLLFARSASMVAIPWYLMLFAFGMLAAQVSLGDTPVDMRLRQHPRFGRLTAASWVFCALFGFVGAPLWFKLKPLTDALVGAATALLLIHATRRVRSGSEPGGFVRFLESRPVMALGHASYSLYLTHLPVLALCYFALRPLALPLLPFLLAMLALGLPASLFVAGAFYWLVERHFIAGPASPRGR